MYVLTVWGAVGYLYRKSNYVKRWSKLKKVKPVLQKPVTDGFKFGVFTFQCLASHGVEMLQKRKCASVFESNRQLETAENLNRSELQCCVFCLTPFLAFQMENAILISTAPPAPRETSTLDSSMSSFHSPRLADPARAVWGRTLVPHTNQFTLTNLTVSLTPLRSDIGEIPKRWIAISRYLPVAAGVRALQTDTEIHNFRR